MDRAKDIIAQLHENGLQVSTSREVSGGINSSVFQLSCKNGSKYALKVYPKPDSSDSRDRCLVECNFLKYLRDASVTNVPTLISYSLKSSWSLTSWIYGTKLRKFDDSHIEKIAKFIASINQHPVRSIKSQLDFASEACISLQSLISSISNRLNNLEAKFSNKSEFMEHQIWLSEVIKPTFLNISHSLIRSRLNCSHWKNLKDFLIASPSDVGIHNTIESNTQLYFFDFEYGGLDDLSKLIADYILQPRCILTKPQEHRLISLTKSYISSRISDSWIDRLYDIKPLIAIKWSLIMLNGKVTPEQFKAARIYYNETRGKVQC